MDKNFCCFSVFIVFLVAVNADAYLDAGTGSYFIQILIGFVAAGLFSLKLFWKRIISFFKSIGKRNNRPK